jgi:hypothetical protein
MQATAFGLDLSSAMPLPFLARARARTTGRERELRLSPQGEAAAHPPAPRPICVQRGPGGVPHFAIEAGPGGGYRIWGRGRGSFALAPDARLLCCSPEAGRPVWERFLVGQVLPFVALAAGLEVLHAGAVVLGGGAVALTGSSGAGKTSLVLELCRRGAEFLSDDVLAVEVSGNAPMAHPGSPAAGVKRHEAARLRREGAPLPGPALCADAREQVVPMQGASAPAPLQALFLLDRRAPAGRLRFEPAGDALTLLACNFNFVLDTPARTRRLLDVCAAIARRRVERMLIGPGVQPGDVADALLERLDGGA